MAGNIFIEITLMSNFVDADNIKYRNVTSYLKSLGNPIISY